jgi:hypothetical protein
MGATLEIEPERGKLIDSSELASQMTSGAIVALAGEEATTNLRARGFGGRRCSTSRVAAPPKGKADARGW